MASTIRAFGTDMKREWRCVTSNSHYYFQTHNGLVVGQIYNLAHTIIWGAKIPITANEDHYLGQYVDADFAKKAVEEYWDDKDHTFEIQSSNLLEGSK